jgi:hypothetical protein
MTLTEKIEYLWDKAYWDAIGAGETEDDASAYAKRKCAGLQATLAHVERKQAHPNGHLRQGGRAGRRQAAERRAHYS